MANPLMNLMAEARRRRVFRTAGVYLVAIWGVSQGAAELGPLFGAPDWMVRYSVIGLVALFPFVVILAWMFDIGRGGIVRDPADVVAQAQAEDALASMPTMIGGPDGAGAGAVIVRWRDARGENAVLYLDEFFIGRGMDCRVRFYDPLVSRQHARVFCEDGEWFIEDLGSRNGTLVANERVRRSTLSGAAEIRVNDAGPPLVLERVEPGPDTQWALSSFPAGQPVAHVRVVSPDSATASSALT